MRAIRWKPLPLFLILAASFFSASKASPAQDSSCSCSSKSQVPPRMDEQRIIGQILHNKDNDGLHGATIKAELVEKLLSGQFKGVEVPNRVVEINNATFDETLNLRNQNIPLEVRLINCHFLKGLDFSLTHFLELWMNGSTFDAVTKQSMDQGSNDTQNAINFNGMKVDGNLYLQGTRFYGVPEFFHLSIGADLHFQGARFFDGELRFDQSEIAGKLFLDDSQFADSLSLADITVRELSLKCVSTRRSLNLRNARVGTVINLDLDGTPETAVLDGLTYQDLHGGADLKLARLIAQSPYSARSYTQLESYYRIHGDDHKADATFILGKQRERGPFNWHDPWSWPGWLMNWFFLDLLLGYGRLPWRALIPSVFFIAVGTLIFWRYADQVIERKPDETKRPYNKSSPDPFWFSLDLFAPVIDLDAATIWMPKTSWKSGWYCLRALRILGWILIPLIVAALTGVIK